MGSTVITLNLPRHWFVRDEAAFNETDHPRNHGKFAKKGGGSGKAAPPKGSTKPAETKPEAKASTSGGSGLSVVGGKPQGGIAVSYDKATKSWSGEGVHPDRLKKLAIPPGWSNVRLSHDEKADLQVLATDQKGRPQYRYSEEFANGKKAAKFERVGRLAAKAEAFEAATQKDVARGNDTAAAVRLMHLTGMRPGGDEDTGADKKAHGATTLLKSHVKVQGDTVHYAFTGKKGVHIENKVTDKHLADHVRDRLKAKDGDRLFNTNASKANAYVKQIAGEDFKSKDLRTAVANRMAARLVSKIKGVKTDKDRKDAINSVADAVSQQLGNTRSVALADYINPAVFAPLGGHNG